MIARLPALALATTIADTLAHPDAISPGLTSMLWWRQSLAHGAPGIALLHIEMAAQDMRPWRRVHDWITHLGESALTTGPDSHLYYGAPALAHVLTCATAHRPQSYHHALDVLDRDIAGQARRRVDAAHARIDRGQLPALSEFDLIRGLTGVGVYLLRRHPHGAALRGVLEYLVRLTDPVSHEDEALPGWWTASSPTGRPSPRFVGGHANTGVAHGIGGPLALLSLAARCGVRVDGHAEAIGRVVAWLDRWRVDTDAGPVWPYWVNRTQLRAGYRDLTGNEPPSWCYGTTGLARAQQLAALATRDTTRQRLAEHALILALSAHPQRDTTVDGSLCHGDSGLALIALTVAHDAAPPQAQHLRALLPRFLDPMTPDAAAPPREPARDPGLLEGSTGIGLAALALARSTPPTTGWQSCLAIA